MRSPELILTIRYHEALPRVKLSVEVCNSSIAIGEVINLASSEKAGPLHFSEDKFVLRKVYGDCVSIVEDAFQHLDC